MWLDMKYVSLVSLATQNSILALSIRYSRSRHVEQMFIASTAVLCTEGVKLLVSLLFLLQESGGILPGLTSLKTDICDRPLLDTLKISLPSFIYLVQNNLLYVAASNLDAATFQVTFQLKILTAALFSVMLLRKRLPPHQWLALCLLVVGVALVERSQSNEIPTPVTPVTKLVENRLLGVCSAFAAAVCSGFAGVYFEMVLKFTPVSLWVRNVQLAFCSIPIGLTICTLSDFEPILRDGFFSGYDGFVMYLVVLQAVGGILVGLVLKYADNLLKSFAAASAIVMTALISALIFDFIPTMMFVVATTTIIFSIFLYHHEPPKELTETCAAAASTNI